jgi:hypothetical protein
MKKTAICFIALWLSLNLIPLQSSGANVTDPVKKTENKTPVAPESAEARAMVVRLNEIKSTDKSTMTRSEKKEMSKEANSLSREVRTVNGGVYLSVGAIVIIALLLIILL